MNMEFIRKLPVPRDVKAETPLSPEMQAVKSARDAEIRAIFEGKSEKKILIVGPCSADAEAPVMEYLSRLRTLEEKVKEKLVIIPRVYTGKPRTAGEGYLGMIHQPDPDGKPDMLKGILAIRNLHMRALREAGFSCADEMLYPENHRYLNDLLSYTAVGARSVEDQQHRLTASGLSIPVGMKNPIRGDLSVMLYSVRAGQHPHDFIYRGWEVHSFGNPLTHAVLRGATDPKGGFLPNYRYEDLQTLLSLYEAEHLTNPSVIVDCSHGNSGKVFEKQPEILFDVVKSMQKSPDIAKFVKGFMMESYLVDGSQEIGKGVFGQSITDPCLGWEKTEKAVLELTERLS